MLYSGHPLNKLSLGRRTMDKRFVATTILSIAVLFSQGILVFACLCPHQRSSIVSCEAQLAGYAMSHEDTRHMQTVSIESKSTEHNSDGNALGQPIDECMHCAIHSPTPSNAISLTDVEAARGSIDLLVPPTVSGVAPVAASSIGVLASTAHGPPGDAIRRHLLLNVFRI